METKCTYCGVVSNNQHEGDGCHACQRGSMRLTDKEVSRFLVNPEQCSKGELTETAPNLDDYDNEN